MLYSSDKQRKFFHTDTAKKAGISEKQVKEFDESSKGKKLPEYAPSSRFKKLKEKLGKK